jgi:hypothetical protein
MQQGPVIATQQAQQVDKQIKQNQLGQSHAETLLQLACRHHMIENHVSLVPVNCSDRSRHQAMP